MPRPPRPLSLRHPGQSPDLFLFDRVVELSRRFGDGDAAVSFKKRKNAWTAYAYYDQSPRRTGLVTSCSGDEPLEALAGLVRKLEKEGIYLKL